MTTCRRGDVVVVTVVFTGQGGSKPRPALVVSDDLAGVERGLRAAFEL
jgi:mRNA-degrading endonuclease toxin of MazEF toxin-antitoxin module